MSFLGRPKSQKRYDEVNLAVRPVDSSNSSMKSVKLKHSSTWRAVSSTDKSNLSTTANLRRRLSSLASLTGGRRPRTAHGGESRETSGAIGFTAMHSGVYTRSRSPSPSLSLTIRRPSGLGRRESVSDVDEQSTHVFPRSRPSVNGDRRVSISAPDLTLPPLDFELLRWEVISQSDAESEIALPPLPFDFSRIPLALLQFMFSYMNRRDLPSLARVCSLFLQPARTALYSNLDMRHVKAPSQVEKCVSLLAANRDMASLVRTFACREFSTPSGGSSSFMTVTFAIAFTFMHQLHTLTLPHFSAHMLHHSTFRLKTLTLLSESMQEDEVQQLVSWLASQPTLISLSLPNLVLQNFNNLNLTQACILNGTSIPHNSDDTTAISRRLLPNLSYLQAPTSLASALVPGRPVRTLFLNVHTTLYDGLRPSALMQSLATSSGPIKRLTIGTNVNLKVDSRTLERVLMSAGAELGSYLEILEIEWVLEDEVLYKLILSVLPRFKVLHTLRLHRHSPPPPPRTPPPPFPIPSPSPPSSPTAQFLTVFTQSSYSPPAPPLSTRSRASTTKRVSLDVPLSRAHERTHLAAWAKQCPSLKVVVFLSCAEWKIGLGIGDTVGATLFTHLRTVRE